MTRCPCLALVAAAAAWALAGGCGGGGSSAAPCDALSPAVCAETPGCAVLLGAPADEVCAGNYAHWMSVPAGCMDAGGGCTAAETCARDPADGTRLVFPSGCLPDGWTALTQEACCPTSGCAEGDPVEGARLCVRGEPTATGEALAAGEPLGITVFPAGCWSTSCTTAHSAACVVTPASGVMAAFVDALFCLEPTGAPDCTPDCSGGGFATCETLPVPAGAWTVHLGDLSVTVDVPSEVPFGGACAP